MKRVFYFFVFLSILFIHQVSAQELAGSWSGYLHIGKASLKLVFHFSQDDAGHWKCTMDSPDQGAYGIEADRVVIKKNQLEVEFSSIKGMYSAALTDTMITGTWKQNVFKLPLNLSKSEIEEKVKHPQEPVPPYPYISTDVEFINKKAGVKLSGTLTLPEGKGPFPSVILISGSGPQNRDEEIFRHKPFLVLSDYLTKNGFAVLRYDDRGVGESEGDFSSATSEDFASDVAAAIDFLKSLNYIDTLKISLLGHSEGGMIAPMVASRRNDLAFLVLLAGPAIPSMDLMILQTRLVLNSMNIDREEVEKAVNINKEIYEVLNSEPDDKKAEKAIRKIYREYTRNFTNQQKKQMGFDKKSIDVNVRTLLSPWFRYFIAFQPGVYLKQVKCPVLALYGTRDIQVPWKENSEALQKINEENPVFTIKNFEGMNHLFQKCERCTIDEYGQLEETINTGVLEFIVNWLNQNVK